MSDAKAGGLFCIPYQWDRLGTPEAIDAHNKVIIEHMMDHPGWFASPLEQGARRETVAWMLTNHEYLKWEIWLGGRLVGMILLSQLTPGVDALLHFTLFGVSLLSARKLLWNFIGHCFNDLGLQRVSFEAPEDASTLIRYMRARLAFKYESELSLQGTPFAAHLVEHLKDHKKAGRFHMTDPEGSLARLGSRRESAHWNGSEFVDLLLLRLLKAEYLAHSTPRADSQATEDSPSLVASDEPRLEARPVPDLHATGP